MEKYYDARLAIMYSLCTRIDLKLVKLPLGMVATITASSLKKYAAYGLISVG